jgi:hypothetical protein
VRLGEACNNDRLCCPGRTGRTCQDGRCQPALPCVSQGEFCVDGAPCCAGFTCQAGTCQLPPLACVDTCAGCCDDGETCQEGTSPDACGVDGETCQVCEETQLCWQGACACGDVCASGCPESSLQAAIDAASDGAAIRLCAETYSGVITIGKHLTLIGVGDGQGGTILDGQSAGTVVSVASDVTVTLESLRVTGGNSEGVGGGIVNSGNLALIACTVTGNAAAIDGGGIFTFIGAVTLSNSSVSGNACESDGCGIYNHNGTVTLNGTSRVSDNTGAIQGGGIANVVVGAGNISTVTLNDNCSVSGNQSSSSGGGITNFNGAVILNDSSHVTENTTDGDGGGIFNGPAGVVTLNDSSSVTNNFPNNCAGSPVSGCSG